MVDWCGEPWWWISLLGRVSIDSLLGRLDVDSLDRVDVDGLVGRMDIDTLVQDTDLGAIMARSTGGVASDVLDAARSQAVGLDHLVDRWVRRILRERPPGPPPRPRCFPPAHRHARAGRCHERQRVHRPTW